MPWPTWFAFPASSVPQEDMLCWWVWVALGSSPSHAWRPSSLDTRLSRSPLPGRHQCAITKGKGDFICPKSNMYYRMCMRPHRHTHTHTHTHTLSDMHSNTFIGYAHMACTCIRHPPHTHTHMHMHEHAHTHARTHRHTHTHNHTPTSTHTCNEHIHTHTHTNTLAQTHTLVHTQHTTTNYLIPLAINWPLPVFSHLAFQVVQRDQPAGRHEVPVPHSRSAGSGNHLPLHGQWDQGWGLPGVHEQHPVFRRG